MGYAEKSFLGLNTRGYHRIVYSEWGEPDGVPLICVHGLTGNGHDFNVIAPVLATQGYRVIAVDLPGRGRSDFLPEPLDYNYRQYCQDLMGLLAHLGVSEPRSVDWLGVSLGGLLGIRLAGMEGSPIRRLILNDVGPVVPQKALEFIHQVISQTYVFDTVQDLEKRMRETRGLTWGPVTDQQWHDMAEDNARALEDGSITYAYDSRIAEVFKHEPLGEVNLWPYWDAATCPVQLLQGKQSVLLTRDIIDEMSGRGPGIDRMELAVFDGCGHVPSLMADNQIDAVTDWLERTKP